ncbi:hypothetical protein ACWEOW_25155, partial [Monashia sp. NPDC004114]
MSQTARHPWRRRGPRHGATAPVRQPGASVQQPGASAGAGVVAESREVMDPVMDPVTRLALLASSEPGAGAELEGLRGLPGLAARL